MLRVISRSFSSAGVYNAAKSSCAAGTPLNLKIRKNGDEPVALEDSQYPEWLWGMLNQGAKDAELKKTDIMKWRRKALHAENTKKIKGNNFLNQI